MSENITTSDAGGTGAGVAKRKSTMYMWCIAAVFMFIPMWIFCITFKSTPHGPITVSPGEDAVAAIEQAIFPTTRTIILAVGAVFVLEQLAILLLSRKRRRGIDWMSLLPIIAGVATPLLLMATIKVHDHWGEKVDYFDSGLSFLVSLVGVAILIVGLFKSVEMKWYLKVLVIALGCVYAGNMCLWTDGVGWMYFNEDVSRVMYLTCIPFVVTYIAASFRRPKLR